MTDHGHIDSAVILVDFTYPDQESYQSMRLERITNAGTETLRVFDTGDPVADYADALREARRRGLLLSWFMSNVADFVDCGSVYAIRETATDPDGRLIRLTDKG
jgi:hypothetical protein